MSDTQDSTPPDPCNFDPVRDAMRRADLSTANAATTAQARLAENSRRVGMLKAWREHPDVVKFIAALRADNDFASWEALAAAVAKHQYCRWSVRHEITCLMLARAQQIGMADLSEADREIINEKYPDEDRDGVAPDVSKWLLLRDTKSVCPPADAASWAPEYRAGLHEQLRDLGTMIGVASGQPPVLAVWNGESQPPSVYRNWLAKIGGERFELMHDAGAADWLSFAPTKLQGTPARKAAFKIHTTGIAPLDALLATGGIPRGARVYVQAATGHGKSVFDLQIAEHFAAAGFRVVLIATSDESAESITARRLQRIMKLDRRTALEYAMGDDPASMTARAKLNPNLEIIDGATTYLEDVIASAPDVIVCDPIQKVRTRAGGGDTYTLESTAAAVKVAEQSGVTFVCASSKVKRAGRDLEASFGGASIPNGATLQIDLERRDTVVNARVLKSRYGGEGETFDLALDGERQSLAACREPDELDAVVDEIVAVLNPGDEGDGPFALRAAQIIARLDRRKADVLAALKRAVELGRLMKTDGKNGTYTLRGA